MRRMDHDRDGKVSFEDFCTTVSFHHHNLNLLTKNIKISYSTQNLCKIVSYDTRWKFNLWCWRHLALVFPPGKTSQNLFQGISSSRKSIQPTRPWLHGWSAGQVIISKKIIFSAVNLLLQGPNTVVPWSFLVLVDTQTNRLLFTTFLRKWWINVEYHEWNLKTSLVQIYLKSKIREFHSSNRRV